MHCTRYVRRRGGEPARFGEADAVFAGDDAAPGEHLREKLVERAIDRGVNARILVIVRGHG